MIEVVRNQFIEAALSRTGASFQNHFRSAWCDGVTSDRCMFTGFGGEGYDCSGFVIASIADAMKFVPSIWPREYRHAAQMAELRPDRAPSRRSPGDILMFANYKEHEVKYHMGIFLGDYEMIHATEGVGVVQRHMPLADAYNETFTVPLETIVDIARAKKT